MGHLHSSREISGQIQSLQTGESPQDEASPGWSPDPAQWPPESTQWHQCQTQVLRSVCRWSAGTRTESSLHTAYCDLVQNASHFVYIENQFFVSGMDQDDVVGNRIAEAIYRRILQAHARKEAFLVMIVLPLLPAFDGPMAPKAGSTLTSIMYFQFQTLRTLRKKLEEAGIDPDEHLNCYGLRKHALLDGQCVTEQIYVHSKVMVVDEQVVIIGSANINDRSLLGMRDSEIDVVVWDAELSDCALAGQRWQGKGAASQLRRALFAQHMGWTSEDLDGRFADPLGEATLLEIRRIAKQNTDVYETLFGAIPSNGVKSWAALAARRAASGVKEGDVTKLPTEEELELLSKVQGHLVEFPLDFLVEEDLAPSSLSLGGMAPDVYT